MMHKNIAVLSFVLFGLLLAVGFAPLNLGGVICKSPDDTSGDCVTIWNAGDIHVYNNQGGNLKLDIDGETGNLTSAGNLASGGTVSGNVITGTTHNGSTFNGTTFSGVDGSLTGSLTVSGLITTTGGYVGITPVATATAVNTPTPQISGGLYEVCGSNTITGTGTIAHGLATPSYINASLAEDATANQAFVSTTNVSATVTLKVWSNAATPVAGGTPVVVNWCAKGTK